MNGRPGAAPSGAAWLGIDGALGGFSAALVVPRGGAPPASRTEAAPGTAALESGLALIERVLGDVALRDLAGIAVVTGPGSFTGLRIALAYAKSLAFAAKLPLVGISSFDAYEPPEDASPCATFVHGRTAIGCVRLRLAQTTWTSCGPYDVLASAIAARHGAGELRTYGTAEGAAAALGERGISVRPAPPYAPTPALAAALRALDGAAPSTTPHALDAQYGEAHYADRPRPAG